MTIQVTRSIIENTDRKLTVHVTVEQDADGSSSAVHDLIDFDDASDFTEDGQSLASDGFHSSTGVPMKSVKIQRMLVSTERSSSASAVNAVIQWQKGSFGARANEVVIFNLSAQFNQTYSNQVDFTSMGGFGSPFANDSSAHRLLLNPKSSLIKAHDGIIVTMECTKVY